MSLISKMQYATVDLPIWLASHKAAVEMLGMSDETAIPFADSMVRMSQGSGSIIDLSKFERGTEFEKLTALFYSYNNTVFNQLRLSSRGAAISKSRGQAYLQRFLAAYLFYALMPELYAEATRMLFRELEGRKPRGDEELWQWMARVMGGGAASGIPIVRDIWPILWGKPYSDATTPPAMVARAIEDGLTSKDSEEAMFDAIRLFGISTGMPLDYPTRVAEEVSK
jgi:hypothetical protein